MGSILTVTDANAAIVAEQSFDAWGRNRNPNDWSYNNIPTVPAWLYRGYTGHEHLPQFGLINMNGRMYDPVLGRMLSPDNYVGAGTQGFNRYTYAHNNPLKFTDPSGEDPVTAALIFGTVNLISQAIQGNIHNFGDGLKAFGTGALQGTIEIGRAHV